MGRTSEFMQSAAKQGNGSDTKMMRTLKWFWSCKCFPKWLKKRLLLSTSMEVLLVMVRLKYRIYNGNGDSACGIGFFVSMDQKHLTRQSRKQICISLSQRERERAHTVNHLFYIFHGAFLHKSHTPTFWFQFPESKHVTKTVDVCFWRHVDSNLMWLRSVLWYQQTETCRDLVLEHVHSNI